jgi:DNA polymerase-3 subunit gamma/tau
MDEIHRTDIALFGVLNGASGFVRGEFFLIDSANPTVREFIKIPTHSKAIKQALFEITGKNFKLGLFKKKSDEHEKRDLLEDLINRAQNDVKINFE